MSEKENPLEESEECADETTEQGEVQDVDEVVPKEAMSTAVGGSSSRPSGSKNTSLFNEAANMGKRFHTADEGSCKTMGAFDANSMSTGKSFCTQTAIHDLSKLDPNRSKMASKQYASFSSSFKQTTANARNKPKSVQSTKQSTRKSATSESSRSQAGASMSSQVQSKRRSSSSSSSKSRGSCDSTVNATKPGKDTSSTRKSGSSKKTKSGEMKPGGNKLTSSKKKRSPSYSGGSESRKQTSTKGAVTSGESNKTVIEDSALVNNVTAGTTGGQSAKSKPKCSNSTVNRSLKSTNSQSAPLSCSSKSRKSESSKKDSNAKSKK